jgi:hypothetical protein
MKILFLSQFVEAIRKTISIGQNNQSWSRNTGKFEDKKATPVQENYCHIKPM